jgi:Arc/MetJ-type ribon-helix-helix transcriptional regulator
MSADPVREEEHDEQLQEMIQLVRVLDLRAPAELARLFTSHGLGDDVRRAVEAVAAFPVSGELGPAGGLFQLLTFVQGTAGAHSPDIVIGDMVAQIKHAGPARKVSVSMPEDLTTAVQQRVGRGKFSQYVTEAVARQLELDLLTELSELLAAEHGPVPEEYLAEAQAAWPGE